MNKDDLIFDWSDVEVHRGWRGVSVLAAVLIIGFIVSLIHVEFYHREAGSVKSASILFLSDNQESDVWRLMAEEEGPFPGRLEIKGLYDPFHDFGEGSFMDDDSWNSNSVQLKSLEMNSAIAPNRISAQGQRFFPRNFQSSESSKPETNVRLGLRPNLVPYTKESQKWLPVEYPAFRAEVSEELTSVEWRFVLNLREDGSVMECLTLNGGRDEVLGALAKWLKSLRFQASQEPERWLGLRVEFLNERNHGTDTE